MLLEIISKLRRKGVQNIKGSDIDSCILYILHQKFKFLYEMCTGCVVCCICNILKCYRGVVMNYYLFCNF